MRKTVLFAALLLAVCAAAQFCGSFSRRGNTQANDAATMLGPVGPDWTVEDKPIAESPDLQRNVEAVLSYDTALFRIYRKGKSEIAVYIAYWVPGKIPPSLVDAHTPDVCWVANGWRMEVKDAVPSVKVGNSLVDSPNHRQFSYGETKLDVLYWQIDGNQIRQSASVSEADLNLRQRAQRRFTQVLDGITSTPKQQVFIRVSGNINLYTQFDEQPLQEILRLIAKLQRGDVFYTEA